MNFLATFIVLAGCLLFLGIGLIFSKKGLKRGCSLGDDCTCKDSPAREKNDCEHLPKA